MSKSINAKKSNKADTLVKDKTSIFLSAVKFGRNQTEMIERIKKCDTSTPDAQTALRYEYLAGRFVAILHPTNFNTEGYIVPLDTLEESIVVKAYAIVNGASFTSAGATKRTEGKAKRTEAQESKLASFKTDWSRLLVSAGVKTVSNQGQHRKPRQTDGETTDKPTKPKKVTIEASPSVVLIADAYAHMQVISKALITFGALNKELVGFAEYTKVINDFTIAVNRLPSTLA